MLKNLLVATALIGSTALADIIPDDVAVCRGKSAGQKCTTAGVDGICQEMVVSRPDYSSGIPPTYKQVKTLGCVTPAKATSRSLVPFGLGLAFLALLTALLTRRGGGGSSSPSPVA